MKQVHVVYNLGLKLEHTCTVDNLTYARNVFFKPTQLHTSMILISWLKQIEYEVVHNFVFPFQLLIYDRNMETLQDQSYIFSECHSKNNVQCLIDFLKNQYASDVLKTVKTN
jgi:hypothetical protein